MGDSLLSQHVLCNYTYFKVCDRLINSFLNFRGKIVDVGEWISNFILHFTRHVINYPCWDLSWASKGVPVV